MKYEPTDKSEHSTVTVNAEKAEAVPPMEVAEVGQASENRHLPVEFYIEHEVEKLTSQCRRLQDHPMGEGLAVFRRREIAMGCRLGNGAFSEVFQVCGFQRSSHFVATHPDLNQAREALYETTFDERGHCNYVIKHLRHDLLDNKSKFIHAASDLVMEAQFLSRLDHPNIIKLRGWSGGLQSYADGTHDGFFLVLDRLDETLGMRMHRWHRSKTERERVYSRKIQDYAEKLEIAMQVSKALEFLHEQDIIFRDLKPDNIGFRGSTVQIFDFGLVRELPAVSPDVHKTFHMSGVGTRRYMAPEVLLGWHYNLKADVYSWSIVFHAMLALFRPHTLDPAMHQLLVCRDGHRPHVCGEWPHDIRSLLKSAWAAHPDDRPTMKEVRESLEDLLERAHSEIVTLPGIVEKGLSLMDSCAHHLCDDTAKINKHAAVLFRLMETKMVGGTCSGMRIPGHAKEFSHRHASEYPHHQHLRSQYL